MGEAYPLFRPGFSRSIQVGARDERLTSYAGLILLRETRENLQIFEWLVDRCFFIITSMAPRQIGPLDLYRRGACAEDAMGQWIRAVPQHLSSANRPKQTTQGRPVHNECERFDTIDAKETNEANLLSALRRPRPAATGKSWHRKRDLACAVGRGRKDPPPPTTLPRRVFRSAPTLEPPVGGKGADRRTDE